MRVAHNIVAIDLGNSSGRFALCEWDGKGGSLREIYQFANAPATVGPHIVWDIERIWGEILKGLHIASSITQGKVESLGFDSWGAEYILIDRAGNRVGHAYSLRDPRNALAMDRAFRIVPVRRIYDITGIQVMPVNTLYGLLAHIQELPEEWEKTWLWLGTPEYFLFRMTGVPVAEYTNAPNSQMVDAHSKNWSKELCNAFGLSLEKYPPIVPPGTILGRLRAELADEVGLKSTKVVAPACHDTASAVAAIPYAHDRLAFISSGTWSLVGTVQRRPLISELGFQLNITNEGGVGDTIRFLRNVIGLWMLQELLREWNSQGLRVSAGQLAQDCLCAPLAGAWVDLSDEKPFLAPGNMTARINTELKARGFPEVKQPHELACVVFRSLAKRYSEVFNGIQRCTGEPLERLCIVGGGVRNVVLNRLAQEATGLELLKGSSEATLIGNAAMQIAALENTQSLEDIQSIASRLRFEEGDGTTASSA
ncbi:MAG: rhamnulokinase [Acidobacteriia bacterium]|nr:rhamnulokinase [Terriglobia bacterium]